MSVLIPLADDRPGAVGLTAGFAARYLRAALDVDALRVIGAAKTATVVVIGADAELTAMIVARILPAIDCVGAPGIEALGVCLVGIAPVFAVEIVRQGCAHGTADDYAGNCRAGASAAVSGSVPKQTAEQGSGDDTCGIR